MKKIITGRRIYALLCGCLIVFVANWMAGYIAANELSQFDILWRIEVAMLLSLTFGYGIEIFTNEAKHHGN